MEEEGNADEHHLRIPVTIRHDSDLIGSFREESLNKVDVFPWHTFR